MKKMLKRVIAGSLSALLFCVQAGLAQAPQYMDMSGHFGQSCTESAERIVRPVHLRGLSYDGMSNRFSISLDRGNGIGGSDARIDDQARTLMEYFFTGISLPESCFWVNLRPDAEDSIMDERLENTDVGRILLEADLQLKKDTAQFTSCATPEGKRYWQELYAQAGRLFGNEKVSLPTMVRPWIVPGDIIISETSGGAYVYKARLKVLLEEDYLKEQGVAAGAFNDPRFKSLNEYSARLIRELIIPRLTSDVNSAPRYAALRQVYYSLILAQWFKKRFAGIPGLYPWMIDKGKKDGLYSKTSWSKTVYFKEYQKSFRDGEYAFKETVSSGHDQYIRTYTSGGIVPLLARFPDPSTVATDERTGSSALCVSGEHQEPREEYLAARQVQGSPDGRDPFGAIRVAASPLMDDDAVPAGSSRESGTTRRGFLRIIAALAVGQMVDTVVAPARLLARTTEAPAQQAADLGGRAVVKAARSLANWDAEKAIAALQGMAAQGNRRAMEVLLDIRGTAAIDGVRYSLDTIALDSLITAARQFDIVAYRTVLEFARAGHQQARAFAGQGIDFNALYSRAGAYDASALEFLIATVTSAMNLLTADIDPEKNIFGRNATTAMEFLRSLSLEPLVRQAETGDVAAAEILDRLGAFNRQVQKVLGGLNPAKLVDQLKDGDVRAARVLWRLAQGQNKQALQALKNAEPTVFLQQMAQGNPGAEEAVSLLLRAGNTRAGAVKNLDLRSLIDRGGGDESAVEALLALKNMGHPAAAAALLQLARQGNPFAARTLIDNVGFSDDKMRSAIKTLDAKVFLGPAFAGDLQAVDALIELSDKGNQSAIQAVFDLASQGNSYAYNYFQKKIDMVVLRLRHSHLEQHIPDTEFKENLRDFTYGFNPLMLYMAYTSRESFSLLANLIFEQLSARAKDKGTFHQYLKSLDPQGIFYKEFILQAAHFTMLSKVIQTTEALHEVMNMLFRDIKAADVPAFSMRLALFVEDTMENGKFELRQQAQEYLEQLYDSPACTGIHKKLVASIIAVYKDKLTSIKRADDIQKEAGIAVRDTLVDYDVLFHDGILETQIVFADKDAVSGHFRQTADYFRSKGYSGRAINEYRIELSKGPLRVLLVNAADGPYDIKTDGSFAGMVSSRSHAGKETVVFSSQKDPVKSTGKIFLVSACRSASIVGQLERSYPGAFFIGVNAVAYGAKTNRVTYYLLEALNKRLKTFEEVKDQIKGNMVAETKEDVSDYVFPSDRAAKVQKIITNGSLRESAGTASSGLASGNESEAKPIVEAIASVNEMITEYRRSGKGRNVLVLIDGKGNVGKSSLADAIDPGNRYTPSVYGETVKNLGFSQAQDIAVVHGDILHSLFDGYKRDRHVPAYTLSNVYNVFTQDLPWIDARLSGRNTVLYEYYLGRYFQRLISRMQRVTPGGDGPIVVFEEVLSTDNFIDAFAHLFGEDRFDEPVLMISVAMRQLPNEVRMATVRGEVVGGQATRRYAETMNYRVAENSKQVLDKSQDVVLEASLAVCFAVLGYNTRTGQRAFAHLVPNGYRTLMEHPSFAEADPSFVKNAFIDHLLSEMRGEEWRIEVVPSRALALTATSFISLAELLTHLADNGIPSRNIHIDPGDMSKTVSFDASGRVNVSYYVGMEEVGRSYDLSRPVENDARSSSAMSDTPDDLGGIDLRGIGALARDLSSGVKPSVASLLSQTAGPGLVSEWVRALPSLAREVPEADGIEAQEAADEDYAQMRDLLRAGIVPSSRRIEEYLFVHYSSPSFGRYLDNAHALVAQILRLQEESDENALGDFRQLFLILELCRGSGT